MSSFSLPTNSGALIALAEQMHSGLATYASALAITNITPDGFEDDLTAFVSAESAFSAARSGRQTASDTFHLKEEALTSWLGLVRNVLAARFGNRWSTEWAQAGFIDHSTGVPRQIGDRTALAWRLENFLLANPSYQVAALNVTAVQANTLRGEVSATKDAVQAATVTLQTKDDLRNVAREKLVAVMRWLIKILSGALSKDDPRWAAFGLTAPATKSTPGQPQNLRAELGSEGLLLTCDAVPLAKRYRWRLRAVGIETEYRLVAKSVNPMAVLTDLPAGQTVEVIVQAVNENLQGVASAPVRMAIPPAAGAAKNIEAPEIASRTTATARNGNGHAPAKGSASRLP